MNDPHLSKKTTSNVSSTVRWERCLIFKPILNQRNQTKGNQTKGNSIDRLCFWSGFVISGEYLCVNEHLQRNQKKDCISDNLWWCKNILQICASGFVNSSTPLLAERAWYFIQDLKCCTSLTGWSHMENSMLWLSCKTLR